MARKRNRKFTRSAEQAQKMIKTARRSSAFDRINYKLGLLADAQRKEISELKVIKKLQGLYGNIFSFTRSGIISKKSIADDTVLARLERVESLAKRVKKENLEGKSGNELAESLNINDRLVDALESAKDYHYKDIMEDELLSNGENPFDLSNEEKEQLIEDLLNYKAEHSPVSSAVLKGGVTFE